MFPGILGFPSQMEDDSIISLVLPNPETYPYAEERRLMYVALTRAKKEVHIFTGEGFVGESDFVKEINKNYSFQINLKKDNKNKKKEKFCPTHNIKLLLKHGRRGPFYGCPKWKPGRSGCNYTEDA